MQITAACIEMARRRYFDSVKMSTNNEDTLTQVLNSDIRLRIVAPVEVGENWTLPGWCLSWAPVEIAGFLSQTDAGALQSKSKLAGEEGSMCRYYTDSGE